MESTEERKTAWTPGEWILAETEDDHGEYTGIFATKHDDEGYVTSSIYIATVNPFLPENWPLLAAAPQLYDALEEAKALLSELAPVGLDHRSSPLTHSRGARPDRRRPRRSQG